MSNVVQIFSETPAEFVRRNGPTLTPEVANRFGVSVPIALLWMKEAERAGLVSRRRVGYDLGAALEWISAENKN